MLHKELPKRSGIYKVKDNIKNLTIDIKFFCVDTIKELPKYEIQTIASTKTNVEWHFNVIAEKDDADKVREGKLIETALIKWQEKRFNAKEIELFSHSENCITDVQRKYHARIQRHIKRVSKNTSKTREKKKTLQSDFKSSLACRIFTYTHEDDYHLSKLSYNYNNGNDSVVKDFSPPELMFIYVDTNPAIMLAKLEWFADSRVLRIYPDFQMDSLSGAYNVEIITDSYNLYSYTMRNASPLQELHFPKIDHLDKLKTQVRPYFRTAEYNHEFSMPSKRKKRFCVLLEIQAIRGFRKRNAYVRYSVNLPQGCFLEDGLLQASTHLATQPMHNSSNIGVCYQFIILCDELKCDSNKQFYILFEVISIDYWGYHCTEGSCFFNINLLKPNYGCESLQCMKPVESFWHIINRYLFSGSRNFIWHFFPPGYTTRPNDAKPVNFHCLYGAKLENVGEIQLKYESFIQNNFDLSSINDNAHCDVTLDDIIRAYKAARNKLDSTA